MKYPLCVLLAVSAAAGCMLPMSCYDDCEAQRNHCIEEVTSAGQDFACESQFDRCTSTCTTEP